MKRWLSYALAVLLLVATVPAVTVQADGHGKGPGNGWGDHGGPGKGKPERGKEKKIKTSGVVSALDETAGTLTIDVKGTAIQLKSDSNTKIEVSGWKRPVFTDIWVGDKAIVEYAVQETENVAKSIKISKQKGSISGKLETIDAQSKTITVSGKKIQLTETTVISAGKQKLQLTDLVEGDQISAFGYLKEDVLLPVAVMVKRTVASVKGAITSVDAAQNTLVVGKTTIILTEKTKISLNGKQAELSALQAGDSIKAQVLKTGDEWIALKIEVLKKNDENDDENDDQNGDNDGDNNDHHGDGRKGEVEGKIDNVDASAQTITVHGTMIQLNESTVIEGDHHKKLTLADLLLGVKIEVKGTWKEKVLIASKIDVDQEDDHDNEGEDNDED